MAFLGKVGKIFGQSSVKQIGSDLQASKLSIFQTIRYMSSSKVFVGGLSYGTDDQSLTEAFTKYGEVVEARVIMDRDTGRSRGFGFVTYTSSEEASSAIQALDGQDLHGRRIRVNYATERPRGGFGGGGYGGGGYGGGGYGGGGGGYGGGGGGYGGGGGGYGGGGYGGGGYGDGSSGGNVGGYSGSGSAPQGGGDDNYYAANSGGGNSSFPGGDFDSSSGSGYTGGDQSGSFSGGGMDGGNGDRINLEGNYKDENDDNDDYAKRA